MTIIYIDIDNHKTISEYFNISKLPTFIFARLDKDKHLLDIISRIEGDVKTYKNLKLLNSEIKNILQDVEIDKLTNVINKTKDDAQLDKDIDKVIDDIIGELDEEFDLGENEENENEEKKDDE